MMTLTEAAAMLPGCTLVGDGAVAFTRVHSDTRTLRVGDLFVALRGERFDANDFLAQAKAAGAVAALAERGLSAAGLPGLQVADGLQGLQTLAAAWRCRMQLPLIAVSGSNGKTTVTQMTAAILRAWMGDGAFATEGNFNNHIGVPLTLLRLRQDEETFHRAGVVELGMNHVGEISVLARIAAPTVALVTNAQREHQEFMASVEAVALENGAAIEALGSDGVAVFPADDAQCAVWRRQAGARRTVTFALDAAPGTHADITADASWQPEGHWNVALHTPQGDAALRLRVPGRHNVKNAMAAAAAAQAAGAPLPAIVQGLEKFQPVKGRSQIVRLALQGRPVTLVDDSYNANPDSVLAAIDVLATLAAPHWLLLGDMGEVGAQGPAFHAEVGERARERGIAHLWCAGALSADAARAFGPSARHFAGTSELLAQLHQHPQESPLAASVLVKGSRFMAMEQVVKALQTGAQQHAA
jgi:UDP-N-acetylmuramoyl-tripeptide--D-alanyl-D-alanine ligase